MTQQVRPIPVSAAEEIAMRYGYDQIVVIGRVVGQNGIEHVTTYGINREHCNIAAKIGEFIKYKIMRWVNETVHEDYRSVGGRAEGGRDAEIRRRD